MILQCDNNAFEWGISFIPKDIEIPKSCCKLHGNFGGRYYAIWAAIKEEGSD